MAGRKITEASQIFAKLLPFNDEVMTYCGCSFPHNQILSAYKMQDILLEAACFVDPVIFALEYHQRGSRIFFCTSRLHFPHYFFRIRSGTLNDEFPTWHEILSNLNKCHLYFDLEYYTLHNANSNSAKIMADFKTTLSNYLVKNSGQNTEFKTAFNLDDIRFVEFDATIETKFSRHMIVVLNNFAFVSAGEVGKFVRQLYEQAEFKKFTFTNKKGEKKESLMDFAVYHEGQNLRMLGSPKFGRSNTLHYVNPLKNHEFSFHENCSLCAEMLLNTLATVSNPPISVSHCNVSSSSSSLVDDPIFGLTKTQLEAYANFINSTNITNASYQFVVRTSACSFFEIRHLLHDNDESVLASLQPLFGSVMEKFQIGNTFWSFPAEFWDPILNEIHEFLKFFRSTDSSIETLRFKLGRILVLLDSQRSILLLPSAIFTEDNSNAELIEENSAVSFAGVILSKKCRQTLSFLLRFLQNFLTNIENKDVEVVDFVDFTSKYQRIYHCLPSALIAEFPMELSAENLHDIRLLVERLKDCEGEIRADRLAKCAEKTAFLRENVKNRYQQEETFRKLIENCSSLQNDPFFKRLCSLVCNHSLSLNFSL